MIRHNTLLCDAPDVPPDAGCSADLTGYGDFAPIRNNTISKNLFMATKGGTCAYGGSSGKDGSKPYGNQAANIVFSDNIFQKKSSVQSTRQVRRLVRHRRLRQVAAREPVDQQQVRRRDHRRGRLKFVSGERAGPAPRLLPGPTRQTGVRVPRRR